MITNDRSLLAEAVERLDWDQEWMEDIPLYAAEAYILPKLSL